MSAIKMQDVPTHQMLVDHQIELERIFSKNQCLPRIRAEFINCESVSFTDELIEQGIPVEFGLDLMVQMAIHKRATLQTLVGLLFHHFNDSQLTCDMLLKAALAEVVDWDPVLKLFVIKFEITADVQEDLDRFQYPLPMVVEPLEIKKNRDTGYYLNTGSVILKNNHHEDDVCLDHLNRANAVRYVANEKTALMVRNKWRNLDKPKELETREEFEKRKKAFNKYDRTAKDVMALLMKHSTHFYLTHKYDKRGRVYCQGYHVNYQGTPWNKAVVEFADRERVDGEEEEIVQAGDEVRGLAEGSEAA